MDPETEDRVNFFKKVYEQDRRSGGHLFGRWSKCRACDGAGTSTEGVYHDARQVDCPDCGGVGSVEEV